MESGIGKIKGDLERTLRILQARDGRGLDLDGDSGDGEKWKD